MRIQLAISTCPNDTFAFHGLLNKEVDWRGFDFETQLLDIEQLNQGLFAGEFEIAKCSFHAAIKLAKSYIVMRSGSAVGCGVGPLLLAAKEFRSTNPIRDFKTEHRRRPIVLCPGANTTATMLYEMFLPRDVQLKQVVFSEIMPMLLAGKADFGVCIHEGRFTWRESGLHLVADLGKVWKKKTKYPLPLGGLVGARKLGDETLRQINQVIRESIEFGIGHRESTIVTMRTYAQEFTDEVLMSHVDLYVNDWTIDLGNDGTRALNKLNEMAVENGIVPNSTPSLEILRI